MANGKPHELPCKVVLNESDFDSWGKIQDYIARSLNIPEGIQYLYRVDGNAVVNPREIQNGCIYVAVPCKEKFIDLNYVEIFKSLLPMRESDLKRVRSVSTEPPARKSDDLISIKSPDEDAKIKAKASNIRPEKNSCNYEKSLQSTGRPASHLQPPMTSSNKGPIRVIQSRQSTKVYAPYGTIDIQNKICSVKPHSQVKERPKIYCYDRKNFAVRVDIIPFARALLMEILNNVFRLTAAKTGKESNDKDNCREVKNLTGRVYRKPYPRDGHCRKSSIDTGTCDLSIGPDHEVQPEPINVNARSVSEVLNKKSQIPKKIITSKGKEIKGAKDEKKRLSFDETTIPAPKQNVPLSGKNMDVNVLEVHKICDIKEKKLTAPPHCPKENRNIIKESPTIKKAPVVIQQVQDKSQNEMMSTTIQPAQLPTTTTTSSQYINETSSPEMMSGAETSSEASEDIFKTFVGKKIETDNSGYCYPSTCGFKKTLKDTDRPVIVQSPKEFIDDIINSSKIFIEREWLALENLKRHSKTESKSDSKVSDRHSRELFNCCHSELEPVQEESSVDDDIKEVIPVMDTSASYDLAKQEWSLSQLKLKSQPCISMPLTTEDLAFQIHNESQIDNSRNSTGAHLVASSITDQYRIPSRPTEPLDLSSRTSMNSSSKTRYSKKYPQASDSRGRGRGQDSSCIKGDYPMIQDKSPLPLDLSKNSLQNKSRIERSGLSQVRSKEYGSQGFLRGGSMTEKLQDSSKISTTGTEGLIQIKKSELYPHNSNVISLGSAPMPVDCCDHRFQQVLELLNHRSSSQAVDNQNVNRTVPCHNFVQDSGSSEMEHSPSNRSETFNSYHRQNVARSQSERTDDDDDDADDDEVPSEMSSSKNITLKSLSNSTGSKYLMKNYEETEPISWNKADIDTQKQMSINSSILAQNEDPQLETLRKNEEKANCRLCCNPHMEKKPSMNVRRSRIMDIPEIREYIKDDHSDDITSQEGFGSASTTANTSNVTMVKVRNSLKPSGSDKGCPQTSLHVNRSDDQSGSKYDQDVSLRSGPAKCYCRQVSCQCMFDCIMRFQSQGMQTSRSNMSRESKRSLGRINEASSYEKGQNPTGSGSSRNVEISRSKIGNRLSARSSNTPTTSENLIIGVDSSDGHVKQSLQEEFVQEINRDRSSHVDL